LYRDLLQFFVSDSENQHCLFFIPLIFSNRLKKGFLPNHNNPFKKTTLAFLSGMKYKIQIP